MPLKSQVPKQKGPNARQQPTGVLADKAACALTQLLDAARYARFDLLCAVAKLAQRIVACNEECDRTLYRLTRDVNSTSHWRQIVHVADTLRDTTLHLYADADFAVDRRRRGRRQGYTWWYWVNSRTFPYTDKADDMVV